jgi:hypothetical protein
MARDGIKTGGRKKGSKNKKQPNMVKAAISSGELPLDFMLRFMRDEKEEKHIRLDMAKAAAPYIHSKLAPFNKDEQGRAPEEQTPVDFNIVEIDGSSE